VNPEIKQKWVAALRSGNYVQGKGNLAINLGDGLKHCCLGVLCELAANEGIIEKSTIGISKWINSFDGATKYLPMSVMNWAGLPNGPLDNPMVQIPNTGVTLVDLNDNQSDFYEIADIIEREF